MEHIEQEQQDKEPTVGSRFADPIAYLARLGIEAQLVHVTGVSLIEAA